MIDLFKKLYLSDKGATAVEYGLILALIALTALVAISGVANTTTNMWTGVAGEVTEAS
ncbi:Flp family type IVb pilin [uncultured Parasphingorhabdus sp.]|uniref:Flp family type IVb pilin n=1 Tax=uncultured Parasphingorhabdus sp. TaxID=2709694 RepID=UPI0030D755DF|tara:strand:- start:24526 stop:24699 length:174 start_codon:yes stop_codon:yes gene_type:complete